MQRLEREHGNLRAALGWAISGGKREIGLRLAGALSGFWILGGSLSEGQRWLEEAVADSGSVTSKARAQALFGLGRLCEEQGDYLRAEWAYEEA
jgi:non-specific serine/threonine protein kinase